MAYKKKSLGLAKTSELVWCSSRIPLAGHPLETELSNGKRKIWGTEPYSSWWCSETRNTNAKACIFGKAHWSVESFHREKLSLRWIALWFRKIYCQSSLSRGRRSFVPKERLVHSIYLCGWRSSRGNEWLWRRVPFPTNCGSTWWLRIEINASPWDKEDYFNRKQYYSINLRGIFNPQQHYQLSWKYLRCKGFIAC